MKINQILNEYREICKKSKDEIFFTGFKTIDSFFESPMRGKVMLIASRPNMGKTTFALKGWIKYD